MKKLAFLCIGLLLIAQTKAQTADEIVNKYIDAVGGKAKLETLKTSYSEGEMSIMNNPAPFTSSVIDGKASRSEMNFNGQKIITCYSAGAGWTVNPLAGITEPTPMPAGQADMGPITYDLKGPLYNYGAKGYKLELAGKEKLNNADVFKLKLNTKDSTEIDCYIDAASWLLLKTVIKVKQFRTASGNIHRELRLSENEYWVAHALCFGNNLSRTNHRIHYQNDGSEPRYRSGHFCDAEEIGFNFHMIIAT